MPIYEYECPSCGERFERMVKLGAAIPACPKCESANVRKLVSAAAFVLKGSGWYKDGYGLKTASPASEGAKSTSTEASKPKGDGAAAAPAATPSTSTGSSTGGTGGTSTGGGTSTAGA